jgi:hypothetical protein
VGLCKAYAYLALPVNTVRTVTGKLVKFKRNKKGREKQSERRKKKIMT